MQKIIEAFEFLGDKILDAIIAKMLLTFYPHANEGMLTDARTSLVSQEPMAALGLRLGLHNYIQHTNTRIDLYRLCDLVETAIGAIYEDGGADSAQNFVLKFFIPMIESKECTMPGSKIIEVKARHAYEDVYYVWRGSECRNILKLRGPGIGIVLEIL